MKKVVISGSFDDIRSTDIKFFKDAAEKGSVQLLLWSDEMHEQIYGKKVKFSLKERLYFADSVKYIDTVITEIKSFNPDSLPESVLDNDLWFVRNDDANQEKQAFCSANSLIYETAEETTLTPSRSSPVNVKTDRKKIVVTGCYDYFHTGHIRFFEEVSEYGDLYVVIGSDRNVEFLKGKGHPHYNEDERLFIVQSIKFVKGAYVSTGHGWMDAEPEVNLLKPDIYAVNEDGDKPEKREFCERHGLQYLILKRSPKKGLPARNSTDLRGGVFKQENPVQDL